MKALFELFRRFDARRIFGFIRRLGGMSRPKVECYDLRSTHALRVEGDRRGHRDRRGTGGISIHALRVEGDRPQNHLFGLGNDFYPRPPGGGRLDLREPTAAPEIFLSTPSGWRATAKTDKVFVCFCAKGRRICLFKTRKEKICRWRFKKDKFWVLIWCEGSGKSVCALASHCG